MVWTTIFQGLSWRNAWDPRALDWARRKANMELRKVVEGSFGLLLEHLWDLDYFL